MLDPNEPGLSPEVRKFRLALLEQIRWVIAETKVTHPGPETMQ